MILDDCTGLGSECSLGCYHRIKGQLTEHQDETSNPNNVYMFSIFHIRHFQCPVLLVYFQYRYFIHTDWYYDFYLSDKLYATRVSQNAISRKIGPLKRYWYYLHIVFYVIFKYSGISTYEFNLDHKSKLS